MTPIYIVTNVEVDGPTPGENSLMSFASVAVDAVGQELGSFEAVLAPLPGARADAETIEWFKGFPEAYGAATEGARPAEDVLGEYVDWVRGLPGQAVFAAHPLAFDGAWIAWYLKHFQDIRMVKGPWPGEHLFHAAGLCLRSYASAALGWPLWDCQPENYPTAWMGGIQHTHRAIDDARGYSRLFAHLLAQTGARQGQQS